MSNMDNYNYWGDRRVLASMTSGPYKITQGRPLSGKSNTVVFDEGFIESVEEEGIDLASVVRSAGVKFDVCGGCDGRGTMVNPAIDAGGISQEQFDDDPEFAQAYHGGAYDQQCSTCHGRTTVPVVEFHGEHKEKLEKMVSDWWDDSDDFAAECAAERRMGC